MLMKKLLTPLLGLTLGTLASFAADGEAKPTAPQDAAARQAELIKKYDKNGDGKLDADEAAAYRKERDAEMLKKYDKNGDGKIDQEERKLAQEEIKKQRQAAIAQRQSEQKKGEEKKEEKK